MSKRSIIIDGTTTSIFMEPSFWEELERRAAINDVKWQDYARTLVNATRGSSNRSAAIKELLLQKLRTDLQDAESGIYSCWNLTTPAGDYVLEVRGGRLIVGRHSTNQIVVPDDEVSRKHVLLAFDGDSWWAVDLGSKNRMRINGRKKESASIKPGDTITIGQSKLTLEK